MDTSWRLFPEPETAPGVIDVPRRFLTRDEGRLIFGLREALTRQRLDDTPTHETVDDTPHRPVNMPAPPYEQYEIVVPVGGVSVSLGGNLALQLDRRAPRPARAIVSWSPASVWPTMANNSVQYHGPDQCFKACNEEENADRGVVGGEQDAVGEVGHRGSPLLGYWLGARGRLARPGERVRWWSARGGTAPAHAGVAAAD